MDEDRAVNTVLDQMLKKKVVTDRVVNDLGFDDASKYKDPRLKMELRHKHVNNWSINTIYHCRTYMRYVCTVEAYR